MKVIKTKRLLLRELGITDAKELLNLWSDQEIIKYTYFSLIHTIDESEERVKWFKEKIITGEYIDPFVILDKEKVYRISWRMFKIKGLRGI